MVKHITNKNKGQRFYSSLSFFYASAKIIMYVTNVLQNRSKLDYSRGGAIMKIIMEVYPYIKIK